MSAGRNDGPPLMVGASDAAALCGVSRSTWCKLDAAGRIPQSLRVGRRRLWVVVELRRWTEASAAVGRLLGREEFELTRERLPLRAAER